MEDVVFDLSHAHFDIGLNACQSHDGYARSVCGRFRRVDGEFGLFVHLRFVRTASVHFDLQVLARVRTGRTGRRADGHVREWIAVVGDGDVVFAFADRRETERVDRALLIDADGHAQAVRDAANIRFESA